MSGFAGINSNLSLCPLGHLDNVPVFIAERKRTLLFLVRSTDFKEGGEINLAAKNYGRFAVAGGRGIITA
jgi:hypothetical protein